MCCSNSTAVLVLGKVKPWSRSLENLAPETSAMAPLQKASENSAPAECMLYISDSSSAWCFIKLSCLPPLLWSPSMEQQAHPSHKGRYRLEIHVSLPKIWSFYLPLFMFRS